MRRHVLNAWCIVSLLLAAVMVVGYFVRIDVRGLRGSLTSGQLREASIVTDHGRLRCNLERGPLPPQPALAGWHVHPSVRLARPSDIRFDVKGFDLHWMIGPSVAPGATVFLISCPLWFAMIVALVSPAIWLIGRRRRSRERADAAGFSVVGASSPDI
jgi:hypothetical protein